MTLDEKKARFDSLSREWSQLKDKIETEQDTRFQVIDQMLTEVLGWQRTDIKTEPATQSGYVDYLLGENAGNKLVVEAKKASTILVDTRSPNVGKYLAGGSALKSAQEGFKQAQRYCLETATAFSALTSGFEWIGFWAVRTGSVSAMKGKTIVFPNLDAIRNNFALFYDLFSEEGISQNLFQIHVHEAEGLQIKHAENLTPVLTRSSLRLIPKSRLASDLETVFTKFFGTMSGDNDPEMLAKCFVESKESREADNSLRKIAETLLNQIDAMDSGRGEELQEYIRAAVESKSGEFVLIVGNKGAGKSTFIDRFFRLVLEKHLRERCLLVRIDLADSDGDKDAIGHWLWARLVEKVEGALYGRKPPTYDELQGVFFSEYERWRVGEHRHLYDRDKGAFKEQFGSYIASLVRDHPDKYVHRLLRNAVQSRKLMPCLLFDNTDHFPQPFQEFVFQFAQSIYRANYSFVICPITDRTIWQLSKEGPLQSYETKTFYLPVPSTKEVLAKRVGFLKEKLSVGERERGEYFLGKGIRLTVADLNAFAACIDDIFIQTDYVSRVVGWLSNHDIRRSLNIAKRIITSPMISSEDLVRTYVAERRLAIPEAKIRQALIFGEYNQFNQDASDYIVDVFAVRPDEVVTPLARLSILRLLLDKEAQTAELGEAYLTVEDIEHYFEPCGLATTAIRSHLSVLLKFRLIEPYDPTENEIYSQQRVRVTHCGHIHYEMALRNDVYLGSMALTTPIRNLEVVDRLRELRSMRMGKAEWVNLQAAFVEYLLAEDNIFFSIPLPDSYSGQRLLRSELRRIWIERTPETQPQVSDLAN